MKIVLIRHAETQGNINGICVGAQDLPICEEGRQTLQLKGQYTNIKTVYTSTMIRTKQTADHLFPNAIYVEKHGLRELDFGDMQGKDKKDVFIKIENAGYTGEPLSNLIDRVSTAIFEAIQSEESTSASSVVFVMHGMGIMAMLDKYAPEKKESLFSWYTGNIGAWSFDLNVNEKKLKNLHYHDNLLFLDAY